VESTKNDYGFKTTVEKMPTSAAEMLARNCNSAFSSDELLKPYIPTQWVFGD